MKKPVRQYVLAVLLACLTLVLILHGCGGAPETATSLGCPSGSILANSSDIILAVTPDPSSLKFWAGPNIPYTIPLAGGGYSFPYGLNYGPVVFSVKDGSSNIKNNICLVLTTDGNFWDINYAAQVGEVSAYGRRWVTKTDDSGVAVVWWSTEGVLSSAATGTTDGEDIDSNDMISATSGAAIPAYWNANYTVGGCPVGSLCP